MRMKTKEVKHTKAYKHKVDNENIGVMSKTQEHKHIHKHKS